MDRIPLAHGEYRGRIVRVYTNGDIEDYQTGELIENIGREITPLDVKNWFGIVMGQLFTMFILLVMYVFYVMDMYDTTVVWVGFLIGILLDVTE